MVSPDPEKTDPPPKPARRLSRIGLWLLAVLAVILLLATGLSPQLRSEITGFLLGEREGDMAGFLSIEPPQVYTRERLVNDRFREATWLNLQLEETKDPAHRQRFSTASTDVDSRNDLLLQAGASKAIPGRREGKEGATGDAQPVQLAATKLDELSLLQLRALYRARLRNDLMDTLLDDGHDLEGNTLYRLNFDAAAMPFAERRRSPGSALFVVRLHGSLLPIDQITQTELTPDQTDQARERIADDLDLFRDWQQKMQVFLASVLEWRVHDFREAGTLTNPVDPKEPIAFDRFLRLELVEQFLRLAARLGYSADCQDKEFAGKAENKEHCALWKDGPGDLISRRTLEKRMELIAQSAGFAWRAEAPTPDISGMATLSGMRAGLEAAKAVTEIRVETSPLVIQFKDEVEKAEQEGKPAPSPTAVFDPLRAGILMSEFSRLNDPELKRATFLVLASLRAMEGQIDGLVDQGFPGHDIGGPGDGAALMSFLAKFAQLSPDEAALAEYEKAMKLWGYGEANLPLPDEEAPPPKTHLQPEPNAYCAAQSLVSAGLPAPDASALFDYGRCMFLYGRESLLVEEIFAEFLKARLSGELISHGKIDTPITRFISPQLASCGLTGCRLELNPHLNFNELLFGMDIPVDDGGKLLNRALQQFYASQGSATDPNQPIIGPISSTERSWRRQSDAQQIAYLLKALDTAGGPASSKLDTVGECLRLAQWGLTLGMAESGVELYLACALRQWLEADRRPVTVYGVSPRLAGPVVEGAQRQRAAVGLGALFGGSGAGGNAQAEQSRRSTQVEPRVIGFGDLTVDPTADGARKGDIAFGWSIRPQRNATGQRWSSEHHRLSAVVSVPSWWNSLEVEVQACWMSSHNARELESTLLETPSEICSAVPQRSGDQTEPAPKPQVAIQKFTVQLPRRVDDVVERFNFDFIKAPYYDRVWVEQMVDDPNSLTLEVGRPGHIVLEGERLWRGTVVTLNNQIADAIVVLPDMRGVIAEFRCVLAPPNMGSTPQQTKRAKVWTSEGSIQAPAVTFTPFIRRHPYDAPCDPRLAPNLEIDPAKWDGFLANQQAERKLAEVMQRQQMGGKSGGETKSGGVEASAEKTAAAAEGGSGADRTVDAAETAPLGDDGAAQSAQ